MSTHFLKYLGQQAIVIGFLVTSLSGFLYTVLRVKLPIPWAMTYLSYSAMAPYQGRGEENKALAAEATLENGATEEIDLAPYFPFSRGRQDVRMLHVGWLRVVEQDPTTPPGTYTRKFKGVARRLLEHERERGRPVAAVRLYWDEWPFSPDGHDALYDSPQRRRTFFVEYP